MIITAKMVTLIGWLVILVNYLFPIPALYEDLYLAGILLAIAHSIETAIFLPAAIRAKGNTLIHILQLFVFGYAHKMRLDTLQQAG